MEDSFSEKRVRQELNIDFRHVAVLVVDMLNDFFKEGGAMVLEGGEVLYERIERLNQSARLLGIPIFWLNQSLHESDKLFEKRVPHCIKGTWGAEIVKELTVEKADIIIPKRRYSGFFQTDLDLNLREHDIHQVIITGVVTNICVRSTVNDAFFLGYDVIVPEDCVEATSPQLQKAHLYDIHTHYGTVVQLDELLKQLQTNS